MLPILAYIEPPDSPGRPASPGDVPLPYIPSSPDTRQHGNGPLDVRRHARIAESLLLISGLPWLLAWIIDIVIEGEQWNDVGFTCTVMVALVSFYYVVPMVALESLIRGVDKASPATLERGCREARNGLLLPAVLTGIFGVVACGGFFWQSFRPALVGSGLQGIEQFHQWLWGSLAVAQALAGVLVAKAMEQVKSRTRLVR